MTFIRNLQVYPEIDLNKNIEICLLLRALFSYDLRIGVLFDAALLSYRVKSSIRRAGKESISDQRCHYSVVTK